MTSKKQIGVQLRRADDRKLFLLCENVKCLNYYPKLNKCPVCGTPKREGQRAFRLGAGS